MEVVVQSGMVKVPSFLLEDNRVGDMIVEA